jgi:predicted RNA binding protein YcfA (HicA-like mRNA interferase family)
MSSIEKLKQRLRSNPQGIRYADLVRVLKDLGFEETRCRGSHHIFRRAGGPPILIVKPHGGRNLCAVVDVKKVLDLLEQNREGDHE